MRHLTALLYNVLSINKVLESCPNYHMYHTVNSSLTIEKKFPKKNRQILMLQNDVKDIRHLPMDTTICRILIEKGIYTVSDLHARKESRHKVVITGEVYKTAVVAAKWEIHGAHMDKL